MKFPDRLLDQYKNAPTRRAALYSKCIVVIYQAVEPPQVHPHVARPRPGLHPSFHLGRRADTVLIGGKMAAEFASQAPLDGVNAVLPVDVVAASAFGPEAEIQVVSADVVPDGWLALDIGPATRAPFAATIREARTVFWNGPMGVFEWPRFAAGTTAVAQAVADAGATGAYTVVGGGDSVRAISELGLADCVSWVSTGGGASLELLEGKVLPGVAAIPSA